MVANDYDFESFKIIALLNIQNGLGHAEREFKMHLLNRSPFFRFHSAFWAERGTKIELSPTFAAKRNSRSFLSRSNHS